MRPQSTFPIRVENHFIRDTRPTNFESEGSLAQDVNQGSVEGRYQPTDRTIAVGLRYQNFVNYFESNRSRFANRMHNRGKVVIKQNQIGCILCDIGPPNAHRHANTQRPDALPWGLA